MKTMKLIFGCLAALSVGAAAGANFPCGTFVIGGSAKNVRNKVLGGAAEDEALKIQAVATNGTILAEGLVSAVASGSAGRNFSLEVPLTSVRTTRSAQIGDEVNLVMLNGTDRTVSSESVRITRANAATNVVLQLFAVNTYTNGSRVAQVSTRYVDSLATYLTDAKYAKFGTTYDPFADYDGDGRSNYLEYLAGTDPFDESDALRIRDFTYRGPRVSLKFEYTGGTLYAVRSTPRLEKELADWQPESLASSESAVPAQSQIVPDSSYDAIGETTIYMLPASDSPSMFYSLEVE